MQKKEHTLGNNKIFVEQLIPEKKTYENPIVFIHGSFGGYWMWNMIAPAFMEKGFEAITFSLRGHNPSAQLDLGEISMADYKSDVSLIVDELSLNNPVIIGHSMGGLIALMYAIESSVSAVISIDPSPSKEIAKIKTEEEINKIPDIYNAMEAGMPSDQMQIMKALPDLSVEILMKMKNMLGSESGSARRDRKRGISIEKENIVFPLLFIGAELGDSLPFGISLESTDRMAKFYDADFIKINNATHPGVIMGKYSSKTLEHMESWLREL